MNLLRKILFYALIALYALINIVFFVCVIKLFFAFIVAILIGVAVICV